MLLRLVTVLISVLFAPTMSAQSTSKVDVFDATLKAKHCFVDLYTKHTCQFTFGPELDFTIGGVGSALAGTHFTMVDREAGGFYLVYGASHGCFVIQHPNSLLLDAAFINPRTAEVFRELEDCMK